MDQLLVLGKTQLNGKVHIAGAKNAILPIMMASLMCDESVILKNIPHLRDVTSTLQLLSSLGVKSRLHFFKDLSIELNSNQLNSTIADAELVQSMRASVMLLGPILSRFGEVKLYRPGGCIIGSRPIDLHIDGMRALGAEIDVQDDYIVAKASRLKGTKIKFPIVSVTGTENVLSATVLAEGESIIENAAIEPEVSDLANFLVQMGAKISGIGTSRLVVKGVKKLKGTEYTVISDRIEAATYLVAAAMTQGKITVDNINPNLLSTVLDVLVQTGMYIHCTDNSISLDSKGKKPKAVNVITKPYPGFPTDMQAQIIALNSVAEGDSIIEETVFESRFHHIKELQKMGAKLRLEGNKVHCTGHYLVGAKTVASDLRASASLVLAALVAQGESIISKVQHIDRGYELIEEKLTKLGADIYRVHNNKQQHLVAS